MEAVTGTGDSRKGFTLIELMVVLTIVGVLMGIAVPQYKNSVLKAKETVLKENLFVMRRCIREFYQDKRRYPHTLEELVQEKYLNVLPVDPIAKSSQSWQAVQEEPPEEGNYNAEELGIVDVKSGAPGSSPLENRPYSGY